MKKNMGKTDRIIRLVVAAIFAVLYFTGIVSGTLGTVMIVLAIIFTLTTILNFCPLYIPFKINTTGK